MNHVANYKIFLVSVILILVWGCGLKPQSSGKLDEIIVFADSTDWKDYEEALDSVFGKEYKTPALEREYLLYWHPADDIEKFKHSRNLFFLGRMDSKEKVSTIVRNTLSQDIIDSVNSGKFFYIPKHDAWAKNQYVLFLLGPNKSELIDRIHKYGFAIYDDFERSYYSRLKEEIFRRYEDKKLEKYLVTHFPFKVRMPSDFFIADESLENNYVWIRRINPDQSIDQSLMVHWVQYNDTVMGTYDWIVRERNKIAAIIYEGDVIVEDESEMHTVKFLRWQANLMEGTWKNPKLMVGGPFQNITFVDEKSNLVYMIDFYVQAIGKRKKMLLDQLNIMAHTFQSKAYLKDN